MSIRSYVAAPRLNARIRIDRAVLNDEGDVESWTKLCSCYAAVDGDKARPREPVAQSGIRSTGIYTVWVRSDIIKRFGPAMNDRIAWAGRYLDIKDAAYQGTTARLVPMICETGLNQG